MVRCSGVKTALCRKPGDQYDPTLASDGQGGAIVVWWDISTDDWDIYAQRISADGTLLWAEEGVPVCTVPGNQGGPVVVPGDESGAMVVWVDYRTDPLGDLYGQRLRADGSLAWPADGLAICALPNAQQQPTGVSDGEDGIIVTWWDERDVFSDIYAQRVSGEGTILWQKDGVPICKAEGVQREPQVVIADEGAAIFWKDYREDYGMVAVDHIYAQWVDPNGTVLWEPDGLPVTIAEGDQNYPRGLWISGGLAVTWVDHRQGNESDIYIQWLPK